MYSATDVKSLYLSDGPYGHYGRFAVLEDAHSLVVRDVQKALVVHVQDLVTNLRAGIGEALSERQGCRLDAGNQRRVVHPLAALRYGAGVMHLLYTYHLVIIGIR